MTTGKKVLLAIIVVFVVLVVGFLVFYRMKVNELKRAQAELNQQSAEAFNIWWEQQEALKAKKK
ncbi:MAG: hypothetical protein NTW66_02910 [Candidatus Magasanikbacteria bacterium]|nr:hypothetical protein [Candidatus Magasanikbacteria bacterium]